LARGLRPLRIAFMGTPLFALPAFEALALGPQAKGRFDVCLAVSRPDARAGRGLKPSASPISQAARQAGIDLLQPDSLTGGQHDSLVERLCSLDLDFIVVCAYGMLLTQAIIDSPRLGTVNIHASLLPRWRGAAPIERAILAGDSTTGVSIQRVRVELDSGPVYASASTAVSDKSYGQLVAELSACGASLLADVLPRIATGLATATEQDASHATYAAKLVPGELGLDPLLTAEQNARQVRAAGKRSKARALIAGRSVSVLDAVAYIQASDAPMPSLSPALPPGSVVYGNRALACKAADGWLEVRTLQPDGKRPMDAAAFAAGVPSLRDHQAEAWQRLG
jgi:methionyl-tRNA formyltransferase